MFKKEKHRYHAFKKFNFKSYAVLKILKWVNVKNIKENPTEHAV